MSHFPYLPLETVEEFLPYAEKVNTNFIDSYRFARGEPDLLADRWDAIRERALRILSVRIKLRQIPLWKDGEPTPTHLELIAWAYSPDFERVVGK